MRFYDISYISKVFQAALSERSKSGAVGARISRQSDQVVSKPFQTNKKSRWFRAFFVGSRKAFKIHIQESRRFFCFFRGWSETPESKKLASEIYDKMFSEFKKEPLPPWLMYPGHGPLWSGWRQGESEFWMETQWRPFWQTLNRESQLEYLKNHNPPNDWNEIFSTTWLSPK